MIGPIQVASETVGVKVGTPNSPSPDREVSDEQPFPEWYVSDVTYPPLWSGVWVPAGSGGAAADPPENIHDFNSRFLFAVPGGAEHESSH